MNRNIRIGCQTYSWEMLGTSWRGRPEDILSAVAAAGYEGIEFSNAMIGSYRRSPERFMADLADLGLQPAAFAFATSGFTDARLFSSDLEQASEAVDFCEALKAPLCLGGAASPDRDSYAEKMSQAIRFYGAVARIGQEKGVTVCVHPHSHYGSLLESAEEYDQLLDETAPDGLMFNPDAGHIVRGGQDLLSCLRKHRDRIAHVHIKDVDEEGRWRPLGQGRTDWEAFFGFLRETHYDGWVVAEEESDRVPLDPARAVAKNREFLRSFGI